MNKYQKALNTIIDAIRDYVSYREFDSLPSENEIFGAMALLRKLVNKETPKKPIDIEFGPCGDFMLCCPTCKHGVVPIPTHHGNKYYPRCPFCGQLLKGDNEDE